VPGLRRYDQPKRSLFRRPRLERRLQKLDIGEARQALPGFAQNFGSRINCKNGEILLGETLGRLARAAADLENLIVLLQIGVRDDTLDERFGIGGARGPVDVRDLIEGKALFHQCRRPIRCDKDKTGQAPQVCGSGLER